MSRRVLRYLARHTGLAAAAERMKDVGNADAYRS